MVATKMFWDMWRNLTNATSNWTINTSSSSTSWSSSSSSSSKNKWSRYNRLRSPPTKSYSQPANLASFTAAETTSSLESLNDGNEDGQQKRMDHQQKNISEGRAAPIVKTSTGKHQTIKHSFTTASFLPFSFRAENEGGGGGGGSTVGNGMATKGPQSTQASFATGISNKGNGKGNAARIPISSSAKNSTLPIVTTNSTNSQETRQQKEEFCVVEHVISDLDDDEDDDGYHLTCNVCDRAFSTFKDLADHQRKKRHYGCVDCDTLFPNQECLDIHREQMCHYEFAIDLAGYRDYGADDPDDTDSFVTDDDENGFGYSDDGDDEEMERLL